MFRRGCTIALVAIVGLLIALTMVFITAASAQAQQVPEGKLEVCWISSREFVLTYGFEAIIGFYLKGDSIHVTTDHEDIEYYEFMLVTGGCLNWPNSQWGQWGFLFGLLGFRRDDMRNKRLSELRKNHVQRRGVCNHFHVKRDRVRDILIATSIVLFFYVAILWINQPVVNPINMLVR